jgi:trans-aconitate 2-methyltransferase
VSKDRAAGLFAGGRTGSSSRDRLTNPSSESSLGRKAGPRLAVEVSYQMADWNAAQYLKFEEERTRPAIDLLSRLPLNNPRVCVDIGCGPGNSTELLVNRFPGASITGLDQSTDMLAAAKLRLPHVSFEQVDLADWTPSTSYDLIFANAVLQWLPDHEALFPQLASFLTIGGCLAVQMPDTLHEPTHALMRMVAADGPWTAKLMPVAKSRTRIGTIEDHYRWLMRSCCSIDLWHTTYIHPLDNASEIVEWMKGSGLRSFLAPLDQDERRRFLEKYEAEIIAAYVPQADGKVLLRFPTLFVVAQRSV